MTADGTAFAALGLRPGADRAAIDAAYKKLIKRYHPDRSGGDAKRAAEINRAYRELRGNGEQPLERPSPSSIAEALYQKRSQRVRTRVHRNNKPRWGILLFMAVMALLVLQRQQVAALGAGFYGLFTDTIQPKVDYGPGPGQSSRSDQIDRPLATQTIDAAIADAARLGGKNEDALVEKSRDCSRQMRLQPSAEQLDRCAAIDDAAVVLLDRDPVRDGGSFSASAVTARQMAAATLLSNDYVAIESRLDRVRARVEAVLVPDPVAAAAASQVAPKRPQAVRKRRRHTVRTRRPGS